MVTIGIVVSGTGLGGVIGKATESVQTRHTAIGPALDGCQTRQGTRLLDVVGNLRMDRVGCRQDQTGSIAGAFLVRARFDPRILFVTTRCPRTDGTAFLKTLHLGEIVGIAGLRKIGWSRWNTVGSLGCLVRTATAITSAAAAGRTVVEDMAILVVFQTGIVVSLQTRKG